MSGLALTLERTGSFDAAIGQKVRGDRALTRQIGKLADDAGQLTFHEQKAWETVTYSGVRHRMVWTFEGRDAVLSGLQLIEDVADHEFELSGQLVINAGALGFEHDAARDHLQVEIEVLTVAEF